MPSDHPSRDKTQRPVACAMCGEKIEPPVEVYNASEEPVHDECFTDALDELGEVLGV